LVRHRDEPDGNPVTAVDFSPDGLSLAVSTFESVQLWRTSDLTRIWRSDNGLESGRAIAFSPEGTFIVSGHLDGTIRLWDVSSGREIRRVRHNDAQALGVAVSPDGTKIASCYKNDVLELWDRKGTVLWRTEGVIAQHVRFSPDGRLIAVSGYPCAMRIWDVSTGREVISSPGHTFTVFGICFSSDGRLVGTAGGDNVIYTWDPSSGAVLGSYRGQTGGSRDITFSPDGRYLLAGGFDGAVVAWEVTSCRKVWRTNADGNPISSLGYSPSGTRIVVGCANKGVVRLLNPKDGRELRRASLGALSVKLAFASAGDTLVASCDKHIVALERANLDRITTLSQVPRPVAALALSPVSKILAAVAGASQIHLLWSDTGNEFQRSPDNQNRISSIAFSPDGRFLAAGCFDGTVQVWEVLTGREVCSFVGHNGDVRCVAFSPNGRQLVSGSRDTTALVWEFMNPTITKPKFGDGGDWTDLSEMWRALAGDDAKVAFGAVRSLQAARGKALAFLRGRLRKVGPQEAARKCIDQLASDNFETRDKALRTLMAMPYLADSPIAEMAKSSDDLEVKRLVKQLIEAIRSRNPDHEWLQWSRALTVLEYIDAPESRELLEELAKGDRLDVRTCEAQSALKRVNQRIATLMNNREK
jgi:WD40 repeat protein